MNSLSLYEEVLRAGANSSTAMRPPRPSAGVVPWREGRKGLEVFWIERSRSMPFMGGWRAFPGGAWESSDLTLPLSGDCRHLDPGQATLATADPSEQPEGVDLIPGLAATALRELFEETGLLIVDRAVGRPAPETPLAPWLREHGCQLDASRLVFAGRWLTPPFTPIRFDNRFFLLRWKPEDGEPYAASRECASAEWIEPAAALDRLATGPDLAAPPIYHLLRVLAEDGPEDGLPRLLDTEESNLGPLRRIELRPGIVLFPLRAATLPPATHTNAYLVGEEECILVDPGCDDPDELARLEAALEAARSRLGRWVGAIFLTHHHPDHVAGAPWLRSRLKLPVWAHAATEQRLRERGLEVDRVIADGESLFLTRRGTPFELRCHLSSGHAPGHLAVEVVAGRDLLAGDLISPLSTVVIAAPDGEMSTYLSTLERMEQQPFRTLFPAHGAPILNPKEAFGAVLEHRRAREQRILEAWHRGVREVPGLVAAAYDELPPFLKPLAARQVEAHLLRLAELGKLGEAESARMLEPSARRLR